jgi:hypothetical protein
MASNSTPSKRFKTDKFEHDNETSDEEIEAKNLHHTETSESDLIIQVFTK